MARNQNQRKRAANSKVNPIALIISGAAVVVAIIMIIGRLTGNDADAPAQQFTNMPPQGADVGATAPAFALEDIHGEETTLASYRGKVVMLNFWATWCGPCKMEIPDFIELQSEYGDDGFAIVGISLDQPGQEDVVRSFVEEKGLNYDVLFGDSRVASSYGGVRSIPTTFLIDRDGSIRSKRVGLQPKEVWAQDITKLL